MPPYSTDYSDSWEKHNAVSVASLEEGHYASISFLAFLASPVMDCWPTHVAFVLISAVYTMAWKNSCKEKMGYLLEISRQRQSRVEPVISQRPCPECKRVVPGWTSLTSVVTSADHSSKCWTGAHCKGAVKKSLTFQSAGQLAAGLWNLPLIYVHKLWDLEGGRGFHSSYLSYAEMDPKRSS